MEEIKVSYLVKSSIRHEKSCESCYLCWPSTEPVDCAAVNEGWKLPETLSESITNWTESLHREQILTRFCRLIKPNWSFTREYY